MTDEIGSVPRTTESAPGWARPGLFALVLAGVVLATLPHGLAWVRRGDPTYLADGDQLLYMAWSRSAALHGSAGLTDAVHPTSGPMMHSWALFVPVGLLGHALGCGLMGLPLLWRAVGGAGLALGLYAALRPAVSDRRVALGASAWLLFDAGLLFGQPFYRAIEMIGYAAFSPETIFRGVPRLMPHLRVVTPLLPLPFFLAVHGLVVKARATGSRGAVVGAGLGLAALFYIYLYFWTAVVAGLLLALVVDPKGRRVYAAVLALGLVLGSPAVLENARVKAATLPDWLHRTEKFVPIGHFEELLIPKGPITLWLLAAPLVLTRRRELTFPWCTSGAALACANHQLVSGLQIENFHWLFPQGIALSVLLAALLAPPLFERHGGPPRLRLLSAMVVAQVVLGTSLRVAETERTTETRVWRDVYESLRADATPIPPGAVLAGDPRGVMIAASTGEAYALAGKLVEFCSAVNDDEFDERLILNMYLTGLDRQAARGEVLKPPGTLSWESLAIHSPRVALEQTHRRLEIINRVWRDPAPFAARYRVTHLLLHARAPSPESALTAISPARRCALGRSWQLWELGPSAAAP